ncbi:MAG: hypothetical protein EXR75_15355 [Myxococcales bacterium]|nr:hypothetical protein [Myxococcales bacterium]
MPLFLLAAPQTLREVLAVRWTSRAVLLGCVTLGALACTTASAPDDDAIAASGTTGAGGAASGTSAGGSSANGASGGSGGGDDGTASLSSLLAALRADRDATLLAESRASGWPVPVEGGLLVVSSDPSLHQVAGDHDGWAGTLLTVDREFSWGVVAMKPGQRYKFTDGAATFKADPWSRAYDYDDNGELSVIRAAGSARLERHFAVSYGKLAPRQVRVKVPKAPATHVLYLHDGQNLFDPSAPWGGWKLAAAAPDAMLLVGIDNTPARMDEYTHVPDNLGQGALGGRADEYADLLELAVRPLVANTYGEPAKVGVMGSSLGGLVSLFIADRAPADYRFAASLSGTLGWGSIGAGIHAETMLERLSAHGHQAFAVYLDSGGGGTCADLDLDGLADDGDSSDNYCETKQLEGALTLAGYQYELDFSHWHEPGAPHNEAAWAARAFRPLKMFAGL